MFDLPDSRLRRTSESIQELLKISSRPVSAREVARTVGKVIWLGFALGAITRIGTRFCYDFINTCPSWDCKRLLQSEQKDELMFWLSNLDKVKRVPTRSVSIPSAIMYTDASSTGVGAIMKSSGSDDRTAFRPLFGEEFAKSSTHRALFAIEFGFRSFLCNIPV